MTAQIKSEHVRGRIYVTAQIKSETDASEST